MRLKYIQVLTVMSLIVLMIGACKKDKNCVNGNGSLQQETRTLEEYYTVQADGDADIFYSPGNIYRADIFAESNIIPLITTKVSNKILTVSVQNDACYQALKPVEVTLTAPECYEFILNGSGDFEGNNISQHNYKLTNLGSGNINSYFTVNQFIIDSRGSGDANLAGTSSLCDVSLSGSGNIYAGNVISDSCFVISDGSGNITVNAVSYLNVVIKGSGNVYYSGNPDIDSNVTGSGELIHQGK